MCVELAGYGLVGQPRHFRVSRKSVQIPDDLRTDLEAWEAAAA